MINIFVTYRCNLVCPYCFARGLARAYPTDMTPDSFDTLLGWMKTARLQAAAFIGGEPTLHPHLADMIERTTAAGIPAVLFTNGLFPAPLAERLAGAVSNFVVNYNDPSLYTPAQSALLHANLSLLSDLGARITFSKNFSDGLCEYGYLLEGVERYGVRAVRYDISRPDAEAANEHLSLEQASGMASHIVGFVRACEERGVRTGLDCCLCLCDLPEPDRRYLERVSMKFRGICHPSIDVHPDLGASYCLPLHDVRVPDVTAFEGEQALMGHFAEITRPIRFSGSEARCGGCAEFKRHCQGGCMALTRTHVADANPSPHILLPGASQQ